MILKEGITNKQTIEAFRTLEDRFREIHNDKYDYSKSIYKSMNTPIEIYCKEHSHYYTYQPYNHLSGKSGCKYCKAEARGKIFRKDPEVFLKEVQHIHPEYDFSKTEYITSDIPVIVICKDHGEFSIRPADLLRGHKCKECAKISRGLKKRVTWEDFLIKANEVHNSKYTYDKDSYHIDGKVKAFCSIHGEFVVHIHSHLRGTNCMECSKIERGLKRRISFQDFKTQADERYNNKFTYVEDTYTLFTKHMTIICPTHGEFRTTPQKHSSGIYGCEKCAREQGALYWYEKPTILYYIKIIKDGKEYFKIGITTKGVKKRFSHLKRMNVSYEIIATKEFEIGKPAFDLEQSILTTFKEYRTKDRVLNSEDRSEGDSEVFDKDIYPDIQHHFI